ncbi:hypothetical protein [Reichenbachiella ulvae]|uniref:Uncharacterized protein n=1 Tax=Reichenbachiella ulvae TaxID=2980104 RepID=A0ABT3CNZ0_9BACT|nr:hypothetical protein [Reichenbachiella ulvae]MCV9385362.1 hypothetical protein [Reichenbachiella ulvae]
MVGQYALTSAPEVRYFSTSGTLFRSGSNASPRNPISVADTFLMRLNDQSNLGCVERIS